MSLHARRTLAPRAGGVVPIDFGRSLAAVSYADDERDPPETGIMGRKLKRVKSAHLYPIRDTTMPLSDDELQAFLRDTSRYPPCARHLGFELIDYSIEGGWAEVAFRPRREFANPAGAVQGGFVCAMLDDAMSFAAALSRRFEAIVPTLQTSVTYLRPTPIARVVARGEVLRFGTSSVAMQGTLRDAAGQVLAVATATAVPRPFQAA